MPEINRRTVVRGAAWATPVVTMGAMAPISSASPCVAEPISDNAAWNMTTTGSFSGQGSHGFSAASGGQLWSVLDNGSSTDPATVTFVGEYSWATANQSVSFQGTFTTQYGNSYTVCSESQRMVIEFSIDGGANWLPTMEAGGGRYATRDEPGYVAVSPSQPCNYFLSSDPQLYHFTVPASANVTSVQLRFSFHFAPKPPGTCSMFNCLGRDVYYGYANDDFYVNMPTVTCSA